MNPIANAVSTGIRDTRMASSPWFDLRDLIGRGRLAAARLERLKVKHYEMTLVVICEGFPYNRFFGA